MDQDPRRKKDHNDDESEIEKLLEELKREIENQTGSTRFEIIKVPAPQVTLSFHFFTFLLSLLLNVLILTSLSGFIKNWAIYEKIYQFGLFILIFTLIEELIKILMNHFLPQKLLVLSFGAILGVATIVAFIIGSIITPGFKLYNVNATIVLFFGFIILRSIIKTGIMRYWFQRRVVNARKINKGKRG